ncbi:unnamed protein product [Penicillium olsonii]|uniref:Ubiquitin-like domain-containing protein n=1 Tax=Penicillium olsonii TaxID=99116 RepID=A0A9W4N135_PENOL|nr:unnamed protein product [Penicillium olsonii]CAG8251385.1 unnamed protein product [Penicillium olsonii]
MGCCASVLSRTDDEPSIRHQTQNRTSGQANSSEHRVPNLPLKEHYNEPIRAHLWTSKRRTWTRAQLDRERDEFFDTRVTGRAEIWAAVSTAIALMRSGDITTAQGIVDAAGITVPTGNLCEGCYDEQGVLYRLPQCIVSDPENMIASHEDEEDHADEDYQELSDGKLATDDASGDELISDAERRRDEKGKTSEHNLIRVLARLSEGGPDLSLAVNKSQTVGYLARKVHHEAKLDKNKRVRIAYLGHFLNERQPLIEQGWQDGHVVNALVVAPNCNPQSRRRR